LLQGECYEAMRSNPRWSESLSVAHSDGWARLHIDADGTKLGAAGRCRARAARFRTGLRR